MLQIARLVLLESGGYETENYKTVLSYDLSPIVTCFQFLVSFLPDQICRFSDENLKRFVFSNFRLRTFPTTSHLVVLSESLVFSSFCMIHNLFLWHQSHASSCSDVVLVVTVVPREGKLHAVECWLLIVLSQVWFFFFHFHVAKRFTKQTTLPL